MKMKRKELEKLVSMDDSPEDISMALELRKMAALPLVEEDSSDGKSSGSKPSETTPNLWRNLAL